MGSPSSFLSYSHVKVKLSLFLTGHTVAMVTYNVKKMTITCLHMFRLVFDTIIVVSSNREWFY